MRTALLTILTSDFQELFPLFKGSGHYEVYSTRIDKIAMKTLSVFLFQNYS